MRDRLRTLGGFNADGRALGLGLAAAMRKQREQDTRGVEDYLRHSAEDRPVPTSA